MILEGDYGPINEELKKPLDNIQLSGERQIHLINDLLDVSRLQTGRIQYHLANLSLKEIINATISSLQPISTQRKLQLIVKDFKDHKVQADPQWLKQVFNNLIGNALKFTEIGTVTVEIRKDTDHMFVAITDSGIGIDLSDQDKLFGRFRQFAPRTAAQYIGSGLGLFISRSVARKMGGDIVLEKSALGQGSTFVCSILKANTERAKKVKETLENEMQIAKASSNG